MALTGSREPSPAVSALRASIPSARVRTRGLAGVLGAGPLILKQSSLAVLGRGYFYYDVPRRQPRRPFGPGASARPRIVPVIVKGRGFARKAARETPRHARHRPPKSVGFAPRLPARAGRGSAAVAVSREAGALIFAAASLLDVPIIAGRSRIWAAP